MSDEIIKLGAEAMSAIVMIVVAIVLLSEISAQSELIKSLSFLFYVLIFAVVIAIVVKIIDVVR